MRKERDAVETRKSDRPDKQLENHVSISEPRRQGAPNAFSNSPTGNGQQQRLSIRHLVRVTSSFAESYIRYAKRVEGF